MLISVMSGGGMMSTLGAEWGGLCMTAPLDLVRVKVVDDLWVYFLFIFLVLVFQF